MDKGIKKGRKDESAAVVRTEKPKTDIWMLVLAIATLVCIFFLLTPSGTILKTTVFLEPIGNDGAIRTTPDTIILDSQGGAGNGAQFRVSIANPSNASRTYGIEVVCDVNIFSFEHESAVQVGPYASYSSTWKAALKTAADIGTYPCHIIISGEKRMQKDFIVEVR